MYSSLPQLFVYLFDVLSVCVFVIRDSFLRKKGGKKRRADLCLNHYSCLIKYQLSYLLLLPLLHNPSSSSCFFFFSSFVTLPPPPSCSFSCCFVCNSILIDMALGASLPHTPLSIYRCCRNPADRDRPWQSPQWEKIWIKSFCRTRTCLDCCSTFSTSSFVTPYSVLPARCGARNHRELCFAVWI